MKHEGIIKELPFGSDYTFVDEIVSIDEQSVLGKYKFPNLEQASPFLKSVYRSHFPDKTIIPGVLLIECMAQIGLGCLGQLQKMDAVKPTVFLTDSAISFAATVMPEDNLIIKATRVYWRFNKLKVKVRMEKGNGVRVAEGTLAGVARPSKEQHG